MVYQVSLLLLLLCFVFVRADLLMNGKYAAQLFDHICKSCAIFFPPPPSCPLLIFPLLFFCFQVIHAEVSKFHNEFQKADSLDDMIHLHNVQ